MVRERRLLEPAAAVHRLTGRPAVLGLRDRGRSGGRAGGSSRFSTRRLPGRGTTFDPSRLATGMDTVVVNGVVTFSGGELTGARAGQVLRRL